MLLVLNAKDMLLTLYTVTILNILTMHTKIWSFQPFLAFTFSFISFFVFFLINFTVWQRLNPIKCTHILYECTHKFGGRFRAQMLDTCFSKLFQHNCEKTAFSWLPLYNAKRETPRKRKKKTIRRVIREGMLKL